jgi:hypothetical protein
VTWRGVAFLCGLCCSGLIGCGSDTTGPTPLSAHTLYWALQLNYHAVNLSVTPPTNTVQLHAIPFNAAGDSLPDATGRVTYTSADSTVSVDSTGLVTANYITRNANRPTFVVARLQYQNVTLSDTVNIQVTPTAPTARLSTFVLQPGAGTSTNCMLDQLQIFGNCGPLVVNATDENGDTLSSAARHVILISYKSSNPLLAQITQTGNITESDTGHVTFTASTWAYGVVMRDSLPYIINWPNYQGVQVELITPVNSLTPVLIFAQPYVIVHVGGTVTWGNQNALPTDIVFDDSTDVAEGCFLGFCDAFPPTGTGNILPFYLDPTGQDTSVFAQGIVTRSFPVAGVYHYHSRLYPASTGIVDVREAISQ